MAGICQNPNEISFRISRDFVHRTDTTISYDLTFNDPNLSYLYFNVYILNVPYFRLFILLIVTVPLWFIRSRVPDENADVWKVTEWVFFVIGYFLPQLCLFAVKRHNDITSTKDAKLTYISNYMRDMNTNNETNFQDDKAHTMITKEKKDTPKQIMNHTFTDEDHVMVKDGEIDGEIDGELEKSKDLNANSATQSKILEKIALNREKFLASKKPERTRREIILDRLYERTFFYMYRVSCVSIMLAYSVLLIDKTRYGICQHNNLVDDKDCNNQVSVSGIPADHAFITILFPVFLHLVIKMDRYTTLLCWIISNIAIIAAATYTRTNHSGWISFIGFSTIFLFYDIEKLNMIKFTYDFQQNNIKLIEQFGLDGDIVLTLEKDVSFITWIQYLYPQFFGWGLKSMNKSIPNDDGDVFRDIDSFDRSFADSASMTSEMYHRRKSEEVKHKRNYDESIPNLSRLFDIEDGIAGVNPQRSSAIIDGNTLWLKDKVNAATNEMIDSNHSSQHEDTDVFKENIIVFGLNARVITKSNASSSRSGQSHSRLSSHHSTNSKNYLIGNRLMRRQHWEAESMSSLTDSMNKFKKRRYLNKDTTQSQFSACTSDVDRENENIYSQIMQDLEVLKGKLRRVQVSRARETEVDTMDESSPMKVITDSHNIPPLAGVNHLEYTALKQDGLVSIPRSVPLRNDVIDEQSPEYLAWSSRQSTSAPNIPTIFDRTGNNTPFECYQTPTAILEPRNVSDTLDIPPHDDLNEDSRSNTDDQTESTITSAKITIQLQ